MPEVSGASSPCRPAEFAMRLCWRGCIEFSCPFPHLLRELSHIRGRNVALPGQRCDAIFRCGNTRSSDQDLSDSSRKPPMETPKYKNALIVGAGEGLSASLARLLAREGLGVALAARQIEKLGALCTETGARAFACNATDHDEIERLFGLVEREIGLPDVVV